MWRRALEQVKEVVKTCESAIESSRAARKSGAGNELSCNKQVKVSQARVNLTNALTQIEQQATSRRNKPK